MRKHSKQFRKEDVGYIMRRWRAGESCSLVGVGSVGKSNLLHHIAAEDIQQHYMGSESTSFKAIVIDPNLLGPIASDASEPVRCWSGYELLMHRIFMGFHPFQILGEDAQNFYEVYQGLQDGTNPLYAYMGLRYFEIGLEYFLARNIKLVFMFDEFEELLRQMPPKFFLTLRGLRDNHKKNLMYLTFSREPLPDLVRELGISELAIEPFTELFTDNIHYVGPYNDDDARDMVKNLTERNPQVSYSDSAIEFLLYASGRYAGILRAGYRELEILRNIVPSDIRDPEMVARLAKRRAVQLECETLWKSISAFEQHVLKAVVGLRQQDMTPEAEQAIGLLVKKRLVRIVGGNRLLIEPPVLRAYIETNPPEHE